MSASPVPRASEPSATMRRLAGARSPWQWAALSLGVVYLILLAHQLGTAIRATNLDADAASGPVIGELFGAAPAHAQVVLGEFGWYATLLFELATKGLPDHRAVWELAPYGMAVAGAALTAWSVWATAGRWAAGMTALVLVCASPATLRLLLSSTQHAPDWLCLALLGALLVLLERPRAEPPRVAVVSLVAIAGLVVGVNAASDVLVTVAALAPLVLALVATAVRVPGPSSTRALRAGLATVAVAGVTWGITRVFMSALAVGPEAGVHPTKIAIGEQTAHNFMLWWKSIAVLGNGDVFGRSPSLGWLLAAGCAVVSISAVAAAPWLGWRQIRGRESTARDPARHAFFVYWCSSALLLTVAFLISAAPADIHADRYLVGLLYAGAAVVPAASAGRPRARTVVLAGACLFALGGVVSLARGASTDVSEFHTPVSTSVADDVARIAARDDLRIGYAGYWDAAPVTWATGFRVEVYPVAACDQGAHLCRFDLHFITSWYSARPRTGSFLLVDDRSSESVSAPTPDLGRPSAVYRLGAIAMYVYRYDLADRIVS